LIPLISKCIQEYKIWFKNPQTIRKFKNNKEFNVVKNIGSFLDKIKNIKFHYTYLGKPESKLYAYVTPKDLTTINYFFPNFHEVNTSIVSLYELTKHEIGHLKDSYFKLNGFKTYIQTINTSAPESYEYNYIINDNDQYTRLNVLRTTINAGPVDHPSVLLKKFLSKVKDGTISSPKYKFRGLTSKTKISKNSRDQALSMNKLLYNTIYVNQKPSMNFEQLFSTFSVQRGQNIYVSFDLIANLNVTSKEIVPKYYYLELSPK